MLAHSEVPFEEGFEVQAIVFTLIHKCTVIYIYNILLALCVRKIKREKATGNLYLVHFALKTLIYFR